MTVVGAGLAGAACAAALSAAGVAVRVIERGRAPGGRMASPLLHERRVDIGAGYLTVRDPEFAAVVAGWADAGLAREWTDTFGVWDRAAAELTSSQGPMRWAAPAGLRSLVRAVLGDGPLSLAEEVGPDRPWPAGPVVLALPDPQAARLIAVPDPVDYDPVIAVVCGFADRSWDVPAVFVNGHPDLAFVADDGSRRGDGAPVLVVHTTAATARRHLEDPGAVIPAVVDGLGEVFGAREPLWTHAHRWTFAKPAGQHDATYGRGAAADGRTVYLAGDQWCPEGSPRVESAWRSGTDAAAAVLAELAAAG